MEASGPKELANAEISKSGKEGLELQSDRVGEIGSETQRIRFYMPVLDELAHSNLTPSHKRSCVPGMRLIRLEKLKPVHPQNASESRLQLHHLMLSHHLSQNDR